MMTIDDFDIVVSTIPESGRIDKLFRYFYDAGICRWMLDYEPKFTGTPPIKIYNPSGYGCGQHFCEIQAKFSRRNIIVFEDDAIIYPDFCEKMNAHLAELPDDWKIFVAGYVTRRELGEETEGANRVTDLIRRNANYLTGAQCVVLRAGEWRDILTNDMRTHRYYAHMKNHGFDDVLAKWSRANYIPYYFAAKSFVGQGNGISLITGKRRKILGL